MWVAKKLRGIVQLYREDCKKGRSADRKDGMNEQSEWPGGSR